jgi:hypothetical protein
MDERRKRGREYNRNEGWKREGRGGGSTVEKRNLREEEGQEVPRDERKGVQQK